MHHKPIDAHKEDIHCLVVPAYKKAHKNFYFPFSTYTSSRKPKLSQVTGNTLISLYKLHQTAAGITASNMNKASIFLLNYIWFGILSFSVFITTITDLFVIIIVVSMYLPALINSCAGRIWPVKPSVK